MGKLAKWLAVAAAAIGLSVMAAPVSHVSANQLTFSVTPELPDNQVNNSDGFFNIKLAPGASQDLTLVYANNTKKSVTVSTSVAPATTNLNGVVDYSATKTPLDTTLTYNLKDYVQVPDKVTLAANESKNVTVHVTMPTDSFNGIIAGGLTFSDDAANAANQSSKNKGMTIANIYSFQLGLLMRQGTPEYDDDQISHSGLKMNAVGAGQVNYRNVINANLQNPLPIYVNQMTVNAQVSKQGSDKALYKVNQGSMQMAPNSNFDFPIALGDGQKLEAGRYHLHMVVYSLKDNNGAYTGTDENGKEAKYRYRWVFDRTFDITGETANKYNEQDVTIKPTNWWLISIILALILLGLSWLWLFLAKRRRENEEVDVIEQVMDMSGQATTIARTTTMREYKRMKRAGQDVRRAKSSDR